MPRTQQRSRLDLLGGFHLRVDSRDITPTPIEQRLLGLLAVCGGSHRLRVCGTLWPEVTDKHAQGSLRTTLWRMHRMVPSLVLTRHDMVALRGDVIVDVALLEQTVDDVVHGDDDRIDHLLRMRGDLLPGWYDDWVLAERARLRQLWLQALELGGRRRLSAGDHLTALRAGLEAIRADPWRESAQLLVARVHLAQGNNIAAVNQIDAYCSVLDRNGVRPSPQLHRLLDSVRV